MSKMTPENSPVSDESASFTRHIRTESAAAEHTPLPPAEAQHSPQDALQLIKMPVATEKTAAQLLSADAFQSLLQARDTFEVRVLAKQVGDREQVIVIFGESHVSKPEELAIAAEVIRQFSNRGVEGVFPEKYMLGRAYYDSVMQGRDIYAANENLVRKGAIDLAYEDLASKEAEADKMIDDIVRQLKAGVEYVELNPNDYNLTKEEIGKVMNNFQKSWEDIVASKISSKSSATDEEDPTKAHNSFSPVRIFKLEASHKPSPLEHFHTINEVLGSRFLKTLHSPVTGTAAAWTIFACGALAAGGVALSSPILSTASLCAGLAAGAYCGMLTTTMIYLRTPILRAAPKLIDGFIYKHHLNRRDQTMAESADRIATQEPLNGPLLVQDGKAHVQGIEQILTSKYGWNAVPLE